MIDVLLSPLEVAPSLLGAVVSANGVSVRLTEVEAYCGGSDPASHAFRGKTAANAVMFGEPGRLYVYFTYGMHYCMNLVCLPDGDPGGVLIRAGEVIAGEESARGRRPGVVRHRDLARGPANLAKCLGVDGEYNGRRVRIGDSGAEFGGDDVVVHSSVDQQGAVSQGPRVGVSGVGGDGLLYPWRFWLSENPTVSAYRRGGGSRAKHGQKAKIQARDSRLGGDAWPE